MYGTDLSIDENLAQKKIKKLPISSQELKIRHRSWLFMPILIGCLAIEANLYFQVVLPFVLEAPISSLDSTPFRSVPPLFTGFWAVAV